MLKLRRFFGLFGGALKCGGTRRPRPDPDPSKDGMTGGTVTFLIALIWPRFVAKKTDRRLGKRVEVEVETLSYLRDTSCSGAQAMTPEMTRWI